LVAAISLCIGAEVSEVGDRVEPPAARPAAASAPEGGAAMDHQTATEIDRLLSNINAIAGTGVDKPAAPAPDGKAIADMDALLSKISSIGSDTDATPTVDDKAKADMDALLAKMGAIGGG
jgi:hypothetical protein